MALPGSRISTQPASAAKETLRGALRRPLQNPGESYNDLTIDRIGFA